jgi:hypothetical protein
LSLAEGAMISPQRSEWACLASGRRWFLVVVLAAAPLGCEATCTPPTGAGGPDGDAAARDGDAPPREAGGSDAEYGITILAVANVSDPAGIAVDRTRVYFTGTSAVMSVSKGGGQPVALAAASPRALAIDQMAVFYLSSDAILSVPLGGGTPTVLAAGTTTDAVAVDEAMVYRADNRGPIMKVATSGGVATRISFGLCYPSRLAIDVTSVYWIDCGISTAPFGGGPARLLSMSPAVGIGSRIVVDATGVYFTTAGVGAGVFSLSLGGGTPQTLAQAQQPSGIAVDDSNVYWVDEGRGIVGYVPKVGGVQQALAMGQASPRAIALDDAYVYWATTQAIVRAQKP